MIELQKQNLNYKKLKVFIIKVVAFVFVPEKLWSIGQREVIEFYFSQGTKFPTLKLEM